MKHTPLPKYEDVVAWRFVDVDYTWIEKRFWKILWLLESESNLDAAIRQARFMVSPSPRVGPVIFYLERCIRPETGAAMFTVGGP